jgi:carbonic anhydrase
MKLISKENFESTPTFDYYKYIGSLTTPPCEEYVFNNLINLIKTVWFVLAKPIPLGTTVIEMFRTANDVPQLEKI